MFKYAEVYAGKVRMIYESSLGFVDFCSMFEPTCFWVDVTGIDGVEVGDILKADNVRGTYFAKPEVTVDINSFEYKKEVLLEKLTIAFNTVQDKASVESSLGFVADAGNRANRDVQGLIEWMEAENVESTTFRDFNNIFQIVSLDELKILKLEIVKNAQYIYTQKWEYEKQINNAVTVEDLDAITIKFEMLSLFDPYEN